MAQRNLSDPKNLAGTDNRLDALNDKLSIAKARLAQNPIKGGMPFVYAFSSIKEHMLDEIIPPYLDEDGNEVKIETAATDGRRYKWHPNFLEKLTVSEVMIVYAHETYHIVMQHCNANRVFGKNMAVWNLAVDYVVNNAIEHDLRQNRRVDTYTCDRAYTNYGTNSQIEHPVWKGNFGRPVQLKELLKQIDDQAKAMKSGKPPKKQKPKPAKDKNKAMSGIYADYSIYGKSAEEIYDEIMNRLRKNGMGGDLDDVLKAMGMDPDGMDHHEKIDITRSKLLEEVMSAATASRNLGPGSVPGAIEDELKKLGEPKLTWQDLVRHSIQTIRQDKGRKNDWTRFRRRALSLDLYFPKKKDDSVRWLCMLDTSGSMSDEDISYGVSQLKILDNRSTGIVVPCDAQPYWNKATEIHGMNDLHRINVTGRGGTVFSEFFRDYKKHIRGHIDLIIVITDGYFHLEPELKPNVDTVFVITNSNMPQLPWGRCAPLR